MGFSLSFKKEQVVAFIVGWQTGGHRSLICKREERFAGVCLSRLLDPGQALFAALYGSFCPASPGVGFL